ncbi:hypothetical protein D3C85_988960 [compost metagenome]
MFEQGDFPALNVGGTKNSLGRVFANLQQHLVRLPVDTTFHIGGMRCYLELVTPRRRQLCYDCLGARPRHTLVVCIGREHRMQLILILPPHIQRPDQANKGNWINFFNVTSTYVDPSASHVGRRVRRCGGVFQGNMQQTAL